VLAALSAIRLPAAPTELEIHALVAAALRDGGFAVSHEVRLGPRCRIDFMVGAIGLEIKKGRPQRAALMRQAARYLAQPGVEALVLVVERSAVLPGAIGGKPVVVYGLNRLWGVALP